MRVIDPEMHYTYFRMSRHCFDHLHRLIGPMIEHKGTHSSPIGTTEYCTLIHVTGGWAVQLEISPGPFCSARPGPGSINVGPARSGSPKKCLKIPILAQQPETNFFCELLSISDF